MSDFDDSLKLMKQIHDSKVQDYAEPNNRMSNFDVQEYLSGLFKKERDKVFATMIGIKIARLSVLLSKEGKPNNESIQDTFIDLANYTLIWKEDYVGRLPIFNPVPTSVNVWGYICPTCACSIEGLVTCKIKDCPILNKR